MLKVVLASGPLKDGYSSQKNMKLPSFSWTKIQWWQLMWHLRKMIKMIMKTQMKNQMNI